MNNATSLSWVGRCVEPSETLRWSQQMYCTPYHILQPFAIGTRRSRILPRVGELYHLSHLPG